MAWLEMNLQLQLEKDYYTRAVPRMAVITVFVRTREQARLVNLLLSEWRRVNFKIHWFEG